MKEGHVMKLAYATCQLSKHDAVIFRKQLCFRQISQIGRLVNRKKNGKIQQSIRRSTAKIGA